MNLKIVKFISVIGIFLFSFLNHFMFDWFPNIFISIFFPVNESIWEHMKILSTSIIMYSFIDYTLLKTFNIKFNNFKFQLMFTSFISIVIYLIIYLPIYNLFKENLLISILLMLFVYILISIISYKILSSQEIKYLDKISITLIIIMYIIFGYLTYKPLNNYIFITEEKTVNF